MSKIGLEIHCQLTGLHSKLFCPCKADYRGHEPNTNVCPVCMGLPGTLPLLNKEAVRKAIAMASALNCDIPEKIAFFRKNYFYPDLPKNFQITQLNAYGKSSIGSDGTIVSGGKTIHIRRIQIEEDPGRLTYQGATSGSRMTLADYNRAGTPLLEIVTEPDFGNPGEVRAFLNILSDLLENLDISDPGLEGAMRADGNVSVKGGSKVEVKNISSFHQLEKALEYELVRQQSLVKRGISVSQETRHWDEQRKITVSSRSKEEDMDYRYFLEGDIPWVVIDAGTVSEIREKMPEGISERRARYVSKYGITPQVADVLSADKFYSDLFDRSHNMHNAKEIANLITTDIMGIADTREKRLELKLEPEQLGDMADMIIKNRISRSAAKTALYEMIKTGESASDAIRRLDLENMDDASGLEKIIDKIFGAESKAVADAKSNPQTVNYLVGMIMKESRGKADPHAVLDAVKKRLQSTE